MRNCLYWDWAAVSKLATISSWTEGKLQYTCRFWVLGGCTIFWLLYRQEHRNPNWSTQRALTSTLSCWWFRLALQGAADYNVRAIILRLICYKGHLLSEMQHGNICSGWLRLPLYETILIFETVALPIALGNNPSWLSNHIRAHSS